MGLASAFDTTSNQTFDLSASAGWTSYIATIANPANIHWGVFGAISTGGIGSSIFTTLSVVPASIGGAALSTSVANYNAEITLYGSNSGFNTQTLNDLADSKAWDDNAGKLPATTTAGLGGSMDFFKYVSIGTKATSLATKTAYATGGDADYFTLSNNGLLTYTAVASVAGSRLLRHDAGRSRLGGLHGAPPQGRLESPRFAIEMQHTRGASPRGTSPD